MNCACCSTPMVWFGSTTRGGLDCPKCRQDRKSFFDMDKARQIANIWHIPVFGPEGEDATWLEIKMRDSDGPGPFEKYFKSENTLTAALLRRSRPESSE